MAYRLIAAAGAVGLIWWASHGSDNRSASTQAESSSAVSDADKSSASDLTDTDADTSGTKGGETYEQYDTRRDDLNGNAGSYEGYGCTQDCSGHDAGYAWAQAHDVTDESDCGGKSWSFQEGCVAYAQEQSEDDADDAATSDDEDPSEDG